MRLLQLRRVVRVIRAKSLRVGACPGTNHPILTSVGCGPTVVLPTPTSGLLVRNLDTRSAAPRSTIYILGAEPRPVWKTERFRDRSGVQVRQGLPEMFWHRRPCEIWPGFGSFHNPQADLLGGVQVGMSSDASKQVASPLMMREQHHPRPPNKALRVLWCSEGEYGRSEREGDAAVGLIRRLFTKANKGENRSLCIVGVHFAPFQLQTECTTTDNVFKKQRPRPKKQNS